MIRLVLFDIDGTLIHTDSAGIKAFAKAFEMEFNLPDSVAGINFAGRTDSGVAREIFLRHRLEPSPENFSRFFDCYAHWLAHLLIDCRGNVIPGVHRMINDLQLLPQPPLIGLLTGNVRLGAELKLRHFNLWEIFATGGFADDHEDRNLIASVAHQRGSRVLGEKLRGDQTLVIGDTPLDIACARAIGAKVLAVATGHYTAAELQSHRPDLVVTTLEQIPARDLCRL